MAVTDLSPDIWLATCGPRAPKTLIVGPWILIGDVFDRENVRLPADGPDDPYGYERKLMARLWGRFVGLRPGSADRADALLRDPSGALECIVWEQDGMTFVASAIPAWLIDNRRPAWRIDFGKVDEALRDPLLISGHLLLDGPIGILPGTVQPLPLTQAAVTVWQPSEFADLSLQKPPTPEEAAGRLRRAIDESVRGLGGKSDTVACEISGGLDSSIVAASLATGRAGPVRIWLNAFGDTKEADERLFVEALARTLDIQPTMVPHAKGHLTEALLEQISTGPRPGLNALDIHHDLDWARRLTEAGADTVLTGKGGDSILLQSATPDVFTDAWLARGWPALLDPDTRRLARTTERSIWSLWGMARRYPVRALDTAPRSHALLAPPRRSIRVRHPWLAEIARFGPSKAFQLAGVVDSVSRHGATALTQTIDVRHPLCAQPVIEACLALPAHLLTLGGRDRGLARQAFRDRLPAMIIERRSKGDMTRIYGRMIFDNLNVLRPWLLEGRLADEGILDRLATDVALTREGLMWRGHYAEIMAAVAFEGWVRVWERRLSKPR